MPESPFRGEAVPGGRRFTFDVRAERTVRMTVTPAFEATGSILAGTARHTLRDMQTRLEIESRAARDDVAKLVETAEQMCFVMDALQRPHVVSRTVTLNGAPLG